MWISPWPWYTSVVLTHTVHAPRFLPLHTQMYYRESSPLGEGRLYNAATGVTPMRLIMHVIEVPLDSCPQSSNCIY